MTRLIVCLFDVYRYHGRLPCLVALESARNMWPELTRAKLLKLAAALPRAKGLRGFREVIGASVGTSESALETVVRDAIVTAGLPGVVDVRAQVAFSYRGEEFGEPLIGRMDLLINGIVVVECDGREYHGHELTPDERYREKQLLNRGMIVLRVGWKEVREGTLVPLVGRALSNLEKAPRRNKRRGA